MTLAEVNALDEARFVALLGGVLEDSPWVAERAWKGRLFASVEILYQIMANEVQAATLAEQLALIQAHPELAGKEATGGKLTFDSSSEQGRLRFMNLDRSHFIRISELHRRGASDSVFPASSP